MDYLTHRWVQGRLNQLQKEYEGENGLVLIDIQEDREPDVAITYVRPIPVNLPDRRCFTLTMADGFSMQITLRRAPVTRQQAASKVLPRSPCLEIVLPEDMPWPEYIVGHRWKNYQILLVPLATGDPETEPSWEGFTELEENWYHANFVEIFFKFTKPHLPRPGQSRNDNAPLQQAANA